MKLLIYILLFITIPVYSSILISSIIPVKTEVNIIKTSNLTYWIHEFSNNPNGYVVTLYTDVNNVRYNGVLFNVKDGKVIITKVLNQNSTIDTLKQLVFLIEPKVVSVEISGD